MEIKLEDFKNNLKHHLDMCEDEAELITLLDYSSEMLKLNTNK